MKIFDNKERRRYYGLRIGDIVKVKLFTDNYLQAEVIEYGFGDNNRVYLRFSDGSTDKWVAEWCNLVEKVEDRFPEFVNNIGLQVQKCTISSKEPNNKPFKSRLKINTVKGVVSHPTLNVPAYVFMEDDSCVECRRCEIVKQ